MSLLTDLIASWELDEASGNALDSHSGGYTAAETGTASAVSGPGGGGARQFNASPEFFAAASNSNLQTGDIDFTLEVWVKLDTVSGSQHLAGKWNAGGADEFRVIYRQSTNRFSAQVSVNGTTTTTLDCGAFGAPSTGVWYQVIMWHDSVNNQIGIRVNDSSQNTTSHSSGVYVGSADFGIGRATIGGAGAQMGGSAAKCRLWKRVLTGSEFTSLYNGGSGLAYSSFGGGGGPSLVPWGEFVSPRPTPREFMMAM